MQVVAEMIATYMLVFVTCGSAALAASDEHKVSRLGASIAGGLVVTVMIYAVGHISGAHMNPAVTLAFAAVRHFPWKQVPTATLLRSPRSSIFVIMRLGGFFFFFFFLSEFNYVCPMPCTSGDRPMVLT